MRKLLRRLILPAAAATVAQSCGSPAGEDTSTRTFTLSIRLLGGRDVGPTPGRVHVLDELGPVPRYATNPSSPTCSLDTTPVTTCTFEVRRNRPVTLVAVESYPGVFVRFAAAAASDTVPNGDFVEFVGFSQCPELLDPGTCVVPPNATTIEVTYQLMTQVTVYQTGAAGMDWVTIADDPPLRVPPENTNILNQAGCRGRLTYSPPCDQVRFLGDEPWHRFTAFVPKGAIVGMFPAPGSGTGFVRWDGDCVLSSLYEGGVCSLIAPDVSAGPIVLTLRYQWWDCPGGPREFDIGGCVLMGGEAAEGAVVRAR